MYAANSANPPTSSVRHEPFSRLRGWDMSNLLRLLDRLQGVKEDSGGYRALCPAHEDKHPSLKVDLGQDGAIVLHCHAGCKNEVILERLGLTYQDLFEDGVKSEGKE